MRAAGSLEYAAARLQARHAARPSEAQWQRIEHARGFDAALRAARETAHAGILGSLGPGSGAHEVDAAFRAGWDRVVSECASWAPDCLHESIAWCGALTRIAAMAHGLRHGPPAPWMRTDPLLGGLWQAAGEPTRHHRFAPLAARGAAPESRLLRWQREWWRRIPRRDLGDPGLVGLARLLERHVQRFGRSSPPEAVEARKALYGALRAVFRRHATEAAGLFASLALTGLEFERLRGELSRRAAIPGMEFAP